VFLTLVLNHFSVECELFSKVSNSLLIVIKLLNKSDLI
jgi:hypothetical protein